MRVAVIVSTYNGERFLCEQMDSIINQQGVEVEIFVRDDGSTDNTISLLHKYYDKYNNIHITEGSNMGFRQSFIQELVSHDNFDYYAFGDQDDFWEKRKLISACEMIEAKSSEEIPTVYYSNLNICDEFLTFHRKTKLEKRKHSLESVIMRRSIAGCTMVINNAMWKLIATKRIDNRLLRRGHDSFLVSLCYSIGGNVLCDSNAFINYRQHKDNTSGSFYGFKQRLRKEWKSLFSKRGQEAEIASALLEKWGMEIIPREKKVLMVTAKSKSNLWARVVMLCSPQFRTGNIALTLFAKIKIVLGLF